MSGALQIQRLEGSRPRGLWDLYLDELVLILCESAIAVGARGFRSGSQREWAWGGASESLNRTTIRILTDARRRTSVRAEARARFEAGDVDSCGASAEMRRRSEEKLRGGTIRRPLGNNLNSATFAKVAPDFPQAINSCVEASSTVSNPNYSSQAPFWAPLNEGRLPMRGLLLRAQQPQHLAPMTRQDTPKIKLNPFPIFFLYVLRQPPASSPGPRPDTDRTRVHR